MSGIDRSIVAIIDNVTGDLAGPISLQAHDAAAVRLFGDVASMKDTMVGRHIEDHDLVSIGILNGETLEIVPERRIIISGKQWLAAQQPQGQEAQD